MILTNHSQKANMKKGSNNKRLIIELSDLELSSIVTSRRKSAHDIEEDRNDEKTALRLRKIGKKVTLQAKKQGVGYPVIQCYQKNL